MSAVASKLASLLRTGVASAVAYRGEFFVWILTTNLPLVMLALWMRVAADGPVGRFTSRTFVAYFLGVLVVRFLNGSWVVWELTFEMRDGALAPRLMRPLHPFVYYASQNLAQIPLRLVVASPIGAVMACLVGAAGVSHDPWQWAMWPATLFGAWMLQYCAMLAVACLGFYFDSALSVWELWMALGSVLSGYVVPIELLPGRMQEMALWLPWRFILSVPLETMLGLCDRGATLRGLAGQALWTTVFLALALTLWRRGLRRYEAFGG